MNGSLMHSGAHPSLMYWLRWEYNLVVQVYFTPMVLLTFITHVLMSTQDLVNSLKYCLEYISLRQRGTQTRYRCWSHSKVLVWCTMQGWYNDDMEVELRAESRSGSGVLMPWIYQSPSARNTDKVSVLVTQQGLGLMHHAGLVQWWHGGWGHRAQVTQGRVILSGTGWAESRSGSGVLMPWIY